MLAVGVSVVVIVIILLFGFVKSCADSLPLWHMVRVSRSLPTGRRTPWEPCAGSVLLNPPAPVTLTDIRQVFSESHGMTTRDRAVGALMRKQCVSQDGTRKTAEMVLLYVGP